MYSSGDGDDGPVTEGPRSAEELHRTTTLPLAEPSLPERSSSWSSLALFGRSSSWKSSWSLTGPAFCAAEDALDVALEEVQRMHEVQKMQDLGEDFDRQSAAAAGKGEGPTGAASGPGPVRNPETATDTDCRKRQRADGDASAVQSSTRERPWDENPSTSSGASDLLKNLGSAEDLAVENHGPWERADPMDLGEDFDRHCAVGAGKGEGSKGAVSASGPVWNPETATDTEGRRRQCAGGGSSSAWERPISDNSEKGSHRRGAAAAGEEGAPRAGSAPPMEPGPPAGDGRRTPDPENYRAADAGHRGGGGPRRPERAVLLVAILATFAILAVAAYETRYRKATPAAPPTRAAAARGFLQRFTELESTRSICGTF